MISAPFHRRRAAGWAIALLIALPVAAEAQVQQAYHQGGAEATQRPRFANFLQQGNSDWVDAHGNPVVLPAGFCGPGGCGPMGGSGPMGGGYGQCSDYGQCDGYGPRGGGMGLGHGQGCPCCRVGGGPYPQGAPQAALVAQPPGGWAGETSPYPPNGYECEEGYGRRRRCPGSLCLSGLLDGSLLRPVDQCGPHYFDFSAEALYWQKDRAADPEVIFATIGVTDVSMGVDEALALTTNDVELDYEPGVRLTGRYDLGALSVLEVSYSGLFEWGAVSSIVGDSDIYTGFSDFGTNPPDGVGLDSTEQADFASLELLSELHNAEISVRRYWVGHNPRVSGTLLAGFRYTRLSEDLNFQTIGTSGNAFFATQAENDLVGFQGGGDVWVTVRQGCRIGAQGKAGIYNNRTEYAANIFSSALAFEEFEVAKADHVSFIGEGNVSLVMDLLPSWSLRAGYDVLFINTVALAANNFDFDNAIFLGGSRPSVLYEESSALYHGGNIGLEYVW